MFSWLKKEKENQEVVESVLGEMKKIYKQKLLPLEEHYQFFDFHSPKVRTISPFKNTFYSTISHRR
jgi:hypothetical protein